MKRVKYSVVRGVAFLLFIVCLPVCLRAQINVSDGHTAAAMAQKLAGPGITILNPVLNCPSRASGFFNTTGSVPGFDSGIVLTNGRVVTGSGVYGINGYSSYLANNNDGAPGDPMLDALAGQQTLDACSLEFDMVPLGDTISVDYAFSSEEYISAVCGPYNDAFAFFISGPGISSVENIALVPGTDIPVTINSINNGVPGSTGVIDSCTIMGPGSPFTSYYVDNTLGTALTHKGLTTVLKAMHAVTRCATYHLKIVIADAGNAFYDSGVFLKAGSLQTDQFKIDAVINPVYDSTVAVCVKGCLPGHFVIRRAIGRPQAVTVKYAIHGNAIIGHDYVPVADSVIIPAGATTADVFINGLPTPATGVRYLQMTILSPSCSGSGIAIDSAVMLIYDTLSLAVHPADTFVCSGQQVHFNVHGDDIYTYSWSPATDISNANIKQPVATPHSNIVYAVTASLPGSSCPVKSVTSDIHLKVSPFISLVADTVVCVNATFALPAVVAPPNDHYVYTWAGPGGFSSTAVSPTITNADSLSAGTYQFSVIIDTNQCAASQTINISVSDPDSPVVLSPMRFCLGSHFTSLAAGGQGLKWYDAAGNLLTGTPEVPSMATGQYEYFVSQMVNGCESRRAPLLAEVKMCCDGNIFIPGGFTPNNDGLNDYFEAKPDFGYYVKSLSVYNRWGQRVYSGADGRWDGTFGGRDAEAGTYYYVFTLGCILGGTVERTGDVLLIR